MKKNPNLSNLTITQEHKMEGVTHIYSFNITIEGVVYSHDICKYTQGWFLMNTGKFMKQGGQRPSTFSVEKTLFIEDYVRQALDLNEKDNYNEETVVKELNELTTLLGFEENEVFQANHVNEKEITASCHLNHTVRIELTFYPDGASRISFSTIYFNPEGESTYFMQKGSTLHLEYIAGLLQQSFESIEQLKEYKLLYQHSDYKELLGITYLSSEPTLEELMEHVEFHLENWAKFYRVRNCDISKLMVTSRPMKGGE